VIEIHWVVEMSLTHSGLLMVTEINFNHHRVVGNDPNSFWPFDGD
jgi:hypothetical protein